MSHWGSSDSGILRKNKADDNFDQLLVFGYSCKIFRDDEKAIYIDQGKHLIPWMGDDTLKIDRYDARGTLSDLKKFEASREGYDTLRWLGLSESEKKLEELCDAERYYSLEINEEEEEMYKEEAAKRQKTNAFAFNYNDQPEPEEEKMGIPTVPEKEEEDEPYKPSPVLDVPVDINIPKTVKEYTRIEKTALFVCRQGPQMEILIKAKQADNPQFSFLVVQDPLYKFYRHLLAAFKNGRYQPQYDKQPDPPKEEHGNDTEQDSHYLHPSLQSNKPASPPITTTVTTLPYRPSADCAYSQLVNRIQGANGQTESTTTTTQAGDSTVSQTALEQQYHQYYYVQQFYEYWRNAVMNSEQGAMYSGLPPNFSQLDSNMQTYIHQMAWAQFVQHHQKQAQDAQAAQTVAKNNSYAQIVSNLNKDVINPYIAKVPQLPPVETETKVEVKEERTISIVPQVEVKKSLLSLAAYGSDSDNDSSDESDKSKEVKAEKIIYKLPPASIQTVIDKMAEYVSKNGEQFEDIIRRKGDVRFDFLNLHHEYHNYYRSKLSELLGENKAAKVVETKPAKVKQPKKTVAPVSFSIKKPKEDQTKEIKSALPVEDSSDEDTKTSKSPPQNIATKIKSVPKVSQPVITSLEQPKVAKISESEPKEKSKSRSASPKAKSKSPELKRSKSKTPPKKPPAKEPVIDMFANIEISKGNKVNGTVDESLLELIELDEKMADEKAADEQDKARQLERKRKAAEFLKLRSVESKLNSSEKNSPHSNGSSRGNSCESVILVKSRSSSRDRSKKEKSRRRSRSRSRSRRRSRSRSRKNSKRRKRSRSRDDEDSRRRRDKKKRSHKRKHSKSKKRPKKHKHRTRSTSRSKSRSRSNSRHRRNRPRSRSRSSSVQSHISINSS